MMKIIKKCNSAIRDSGLRSFQPGFSFPTKYLILFLISWVFSSANALAETALVNDGIVTGNITTVGDINSFVFTASAGDAVHIRVVNPSGNLSPAVWLYNPDGTLERYREDSTTVAFNCHSSSSDCRLDQAGTYRLVVADDDNDYTGDFEIHFDGPPQTVIGPPQPDACTLDADGDERVDALTDGLLFIRHMFGIQSASLVNDAVASSCTRCSETVVSAYLDQCIEQRTSDIDGNGAVDALTDGLLIIRYIFGIRGDSLIEESVANDCSRCTVPEIEAYMQGLMP